MTALFIRIRDIANVGFFMIYEGKLSYHSYVNNCDMTVRPGNLQRHVDRFIKRGYQISIRAE